MRCSRALFLLESVILRLILMNRAFWNVLGLLSLLVEPALICPIRLCVLEFFEVLCFSRLSSYLLGDFEEPNFRLFLLVALLVPDYLDLAEFYRDLIALFLVAFELEGTNTSTSSRLDD